MHKHARPMSTRDMILETLGDEIWEKQELLDKIAETKTPKKAAEALQFLVDNKYITELDYIADDPEGGQVSVIVKTERAEGNPPNRNNNNSNNNNNKKDSHKMDSDLRHDSKSPHKTEEITPNKNPTPTAGVSPSQDKNDELNGHNEPKLQTPILNKGPVRRKRLPFHSPRTLSSTKDNAEPDSKRASIQPESDMVLNTSEMKIPTPKKNIGNPSITTANTTPAGTPSQVRKHSIPELISLTEKWKDVCKQVLHELKEHSKDPDVDYPKILDFFRIEPDILRYNAEEDCLE